MSKTENDWSFSTYAHDNLAIPKIYDKLLWKILKIDEKEAVDLDLNHGIDYLLLDSDAKLISVQERFRDYYYSNYEDATLRFRREFNPDPERVKSEFYKIKADYLVYGITNGKKFIDKRHTLTDFDKWVVLDMQFIKEKFEKGLIKIVTNTKNIKCWLDDDVLCCPENFNGDGSSSFIPFDVPLINKLWGKIPIVASKGFF